MRTILSRVRTYTFAARDARASALVLEKVFRAGEAASLEGSGPALLSIEKWLASKRPFPPSRARELSGRLLAAVLGERLTAGQTMGKALLDEAEGALGEGLDVAAALALIMGETKDLGQRDESYGESFATLLEGIDDRLGDFLRSEDLLPFDLAWIGKAAGLAREARQRRETLNLSPGLLLEALGQELRSA